MNRYEESIIDFMKEPVFAMKLYAEGGWVKYEEAQAKIAELKADLEKHKDWNSVKVNEITVATIKAQAIREMLSVIKYNKGGKSYSEARILKYIDSLENK